MRRFRKWAFVLVFAAAVTVGAAGRAPVADVSGRTTTTFEEIVTFVLDFVVLYSRYSIPPG